MIAAALSSIWPSNRAKVSTEVYGQVCDLLLSSRKTVVLTGAGISTQSGIPDFRSPESGIWQHVDPLEVASIWGFRQHPERFYNWLRPLAQKLMQATPNSAHRALAYLEDMGLLDLVITQNIDNLHQQAGSKNVLHVHGSTSGAVCLGCGYHEEESSYWRPFLSGESTAPPRCPRCGGILKPNVILFGEELAHDDLVRAQEAALDCDLILAAGTSLEVMPAADLPLLAKRRGANLVILNLSGTLADHRADVIIRDNLVVSLPRLVDLCRKQKRT